MKISQIRDKVNSPQKPGLQADLKKHSSLTQMCSTVPLQWGGAETIPTAEPGWGFLQVTGWSKGGW